jgi:protein-tyrosine phosphatase
MSHPLDVEGGYNVRDLGEYPTKDGHSTQQHVLIRAGNLDKLSAVGQQQLIEYGVKTIIDIRDEWEAVNFPNPFAQSGEVTCLNLPLIGDALSNNPTWKAETQSYSALYELYTKYLDHCQRQLGAIVSAIAENTFATLFYCHAGKDRTGIVTALVLGAIGVPDATIAEDYALSAPQIAHLIKQWREYAVQHGQDMQHFERDVASNSETMISMLNYLTHRYGSVANYLYSCGVSSNQLEHLRMHFVC